MKIWLALAAVVAVSGTAQAADVVHFTAEGDFASVNWSGDSSGGDLYVTRTQGTYGTSTFLGFYLEWSVPNPDFPGCLNNPPPPKCDPIGPCRKPLPEPYCDPYLYYFAYGDGEIPNGDFTANPQRDQLQTNIASNPSFYVYSNDPTFTLGSGLISLTWTRTGLAWSRYQSTGEDHFADVVRHFNGQYSIGTAKATGSVLGISIGTSAFAAKGQNHANDICVSHGTTDLCAPPPPPPPR